MNSSSPRVIVLDTTYALPIFNVKVDLGNTGDQDLFHLWNNGIDGYDIILPSVCLLECAFKVVRVAQKEGNPKILDIYPSHLPTILTSKFVSIFDAWKDPVTSEIALRLRAAGHKDLMDCWIAASAVTLQAILISEDEPLSQAMASIPDCKSTPVWKWKEFQSRIKISP